MYYGTGLQNKYVKILTGIVQHYNPSKYWRMREFVISENSGKVLNKVIKYWYLYRIKKNWTHFNNSEYGNQYWIWSEI